jgi:energy-coupling factor transporter ATP-binding protein EcfA2
MRLKSIEYAERDDSPDQWTVRGLTLGDINLLVGKNASGKSRILNLIHNLARSISGLRDLRNGHFHACFQDGDAEMVYELEVEDGKVVREILTRDGEPLLDRGSGGRGEIFAVKEDRQIEFQTPEHQLAVSARRDSLQHPYFEPLHRWANSLYHFAFGTPLGKEKLAVFVQGNGQNDAFDPKDTSQVVGIFNRGRKELGDQFITSVVDDFKAIGYPIEDVGIQTPQGVKFVGLVAGELAGIYVKEADLSGRTDQLSMSTGMFRALSVVVQVNYCVLADTPSCILIDDIGEGLDFERSCNLIEVLMRKARSSAVQLLMATNDRFVMNRVPLETWSVLDRQGSAVQIRNYANSKNIFDDFKFTGLNNFDFLAFDYLHTGKADE